MCGTLTTSTEKIHKPYRGGDYFEKKEEKLIVSLFKPRLFHNYLYF